MQIGNGLQQFLRAATLEQIPAGSRAEGGENFIRLLINGEDQHIRIEPFFLESLNTFNAAHSGQCDVHQHHVRGFVRKLFECVLSGAIQARQPKTLG